MTRIHQVGVYGQRKGQPAAMDVRRSVVLTLMLLHQNLNQETAADLFSVSQSTVSRTYRRMVPLIEQVLCLHRPPLTHAVSGRVVAVDGTDVPTGNRAAHESNYSGKRRRRGLVVQVTCTTDGTRAAVSEPLPGRTHDRRAFAETGRETALANNVVIADPAYQGTDAITPRKRSKNLNLSLGDQANNKSISTIRSAVERRIAHLKNWKILATGFRSRLAELPNVIRTITALEFYRLHFAIRREHTRYTTQEQTTTISRKVGHQCYSSCG